MATTFEGRTFDRVPSAPGPHWPASSLVFRSKEDVVLQGEIDALTARVAALEGNVPAPPAPTPTPVPPSPAPSRAPGLILDQGQEGECVGHGWTAWAEWKGEPVPKTVLENPWAETIYAEAGVIEGQWPDVNHPDDQAGTSVVGGAKAAKKLYLPTLQYRQCASVDEARKAVATPGLGVVVGTDWHQGMMDVDAHGVIHASGPVVGGHCLFWLDNTSTGNAVWQNSWGSSWGQSGVCEITDADLRKLFAGGNCEFWVPTA